MSYILDALRRAEAERRRAQAPALQQVTQGAEWGQAAPARPARRHWVQALGAVLLAAGAFTAWRLLAPDPVAAPAAAPLAATSVPAATTPAQTVLPAPLPLPQPAPVVLPEASAPAAAAASMAAPAAPPAPVVAASAPAPVEQPVLAALLPEPQRARIAALAIGGAVHSQDRGQSFVLVGGQPVREGQPVGAGVTLERIEPHALLLRVDGRLVRWPL